MTLLGVSLVLALGGIVATQRGLGHVARHGPHDPHAYWALGLLGLGPAWLVTFAALLEPTPGARPQLVSAVGWLVSAAIALVGVIVTEALVRRADELAQASTSTGPEPGRMWRLGVVAFAPAWGLCVITYLVRVVR